MFDSALIDAVGSGEQSAFPTWAFPSQMGSSIGSTRAADSSEFPKASEQNGIPTQIGHRNDFKREDARASESLEFPELKRLPNHTGVSKGSKPEETTTAGFLEFTGTWEQNALLSESEPEEETTVVDSPEFPKASGESGLPSKIGFSNGSKLEETS